jgi:hypothetical protein
MFCDAHRGSATALLPTESVEHMKSLMIVDDKEDTSDADKCFRVGSLTVQAMGDIEQTMDGFHSRVSTLGVHSWCPSAKHAL